MRRTRRDRPPSDLRPALALLALGSLAIASPARATVEIVGPDDVLHRFVTIRDGRSVLAVDGREWTLVTDPGSPLVSQLGDGRFHPMDPDEVRAALRALGPVRLPAETLVLVLPFPRTVPVESSCEGRVVFLAPGIREVRREHVHATVVHEIGHLVQHARVPETSGAWREYLALRGLDDPRFHSGAVHRDRPREIFAEDFRWLYGGDLANYAGGLENGDLPLPDRVPGLAAWFERTIDRAALARLEEPEPVSRPNPFDGSLAGSTEIRFAIAGGFAGTARADVIDLLGRRVRELTGSPVGAGEVSFRWDGRDRSGSRVASGIFFVRWREHPEAGTARVHVLR